MLWPCMDEDGWIYILVNRNWKARVEGVDRAPHGFKWTHTVATKV
jgi:hypothetical protein